MKNRELNQEGVGLGLTISKNIAKALGGDISAQSQIGIGSSFTLKIPVTFVPLRIYISEYLEKVQKEPLNVAQKQEQSVNEELKFCIDNKSPKFTINYSFGITPKKIELRTNNKSD